MKNTKTLKQIKKENNKKYYLNLIENLYFIRIQYIKDENIKNQLTNQVIDFIQYLENTNVLTVNFTTVKNEYFKIKKVVNNL